MNENKNENNEKNIKVNNINNSDANETEVIMNQLELLSFTEDKSFDEPTLFQKSTINNKNGNNKELINNIYSNAHSKEDESSINNYINIENIEVNMNYNSKKNVLKLKLDNVLTSLKLLEIKVNNKYYNSIIKFKNYLNDNILVSKYFEHFNDLFNLVIELIFIIKKEAEKNENINNKNQKNGIILKLERDIINKDKQIETLLIKLKVEQQKLQKNTKDNNNELIILQKENKELYYQLGLYKKYIKRIDNNNLALEEQLNNIILEKISKRPISVKNKFFSQINGQTINMNNNININNFNEIYNQNSNANTNTNANSEHIIINEPYKENNFINYKKVNKGEANIQFRKLNLSLINLLKEINKILQVYDLSLKKIKLEDSQTDTITNLNNMFEFGILIDYDKMRQFQKSFLGNMDKILNKIDNLISAYKNNLTKVKDKIHLSPTKKQISSKSIKNIEKSFEITNEKQHSNKIIVHRKQISSIK